MTEPAGGELLTARELEIATLAVAALTSRQIGVRLFLSARTVEAHLHHIYIKTGTGSRARLAVWLRQSGITASGRTQPT